MKCVNHLLWQQILRHALRLHSHITYDYKMYKNKNIKIFFFFYFFLGLGSRITINKSNIEKKKNKEKTPICHYLSIKRKDKSVNVTHAKCQVISHSTWQKPTQATHVMWECFWGKEGKKGQKVKECFCFWLLLLPVQL